MDQSRLNEIIQELQNPNLTVKLSPEPSMMGPGYISAKAVEITEAKERVNKLAEELELSISSSEVELGDLQEQQDLRIDLAITGFLPVEVEGLDASARKALAKQKAEQGWLEEQSFSAVTQGINLPPGYSLRTRIHQINSWVKQIKTVLKIVDNRRQSLIRLDSTLRLQVTSLQVEAGLFGKRIPETPRPGYSGGSFRTPLDDSIPGGIEPGLVGNDTFNELLSGDS